MTRDNSALGLRFGKAFRGRDRPPATVKNPRTDATHEVLLDEHIRPDTTLESLARLTPVLIRQETESTVTAGNASGQNDGAAACLVTTAACAADLDVAITARLRSWSVAGVESEVMRLGPVPATAAALSAAGLTLADIDLIEINEAFAAQVFGCTREWGQTLGDLDRVNVNGSGISLGHPIGATGARLLATATGLRELERRDRRYLLVTMCSAGATDLPPSSSGSLPDGDCLCFDAARAWQRKGPTLTLSTSFTRLRWDRAPRGHVGRDMQGGSLT